MYEYIILCPDISPPVLQGPSRRQGPGARACVLACGAAWDDGHHRADGLELCQCNLKAHPPRLTHASHRTKPYGIMLGAALINIAEMLRGIL